MDKRKTRLLVSRGVTAALTATMVVGSLPTAAIAETLGTNGAQQAITAGLGGQSAVADEPAATTPATEAAAATEAAQAEAASTPAATESAQATDDQQATTQLSAEQAAQLLADGSTSPALPAPSVKPSDLKDGTYTATIETVNAANQQQLSMSNSAIDHTVKIVVKDGKATLTLTSTGMKNTITNDGSIVYLGAVYYYNLSGTKTPVKVLDTVKGEDGKDFTDNYSKYLERVDASAYPKTVEIPLDETTTVDNYYKLGVFVPVMESFGDATGMVGMGNQNVLLNVDWSSLKSETPAEADTTELKAAIEEAQKVEQGAKTDEAFQTLQDAIASAQKVVDSKPTDQTVVDKAVDTLRAAVKAFNESADKPAGPVLEKGKTYYVPVQILKADNSGDTSMADAFFQDKARVTKVTDTSYTVSLTTKLTAEQKGWISDFKVGDQAAQSATAEGDENNVTFTFTVSDISKPLTASATVKPMGYAPSFNVVLDTANLEDEANTDDLYAEIQKAEAIKITDDAYKNKTLAAWYDLQDAISAASVLRSVPPAASEQAKVDQALEDLQAAEDAFKAAPERADNATFKPVVGKEYTANVRWIGKVAGPMASVAENMINKNIKHEVTFTYNEDGTYTFKIHGTGADKNHAIQKIAVGDKDFAPDYDADPNGVFTATFSSVAGEQAFKVFIGGAMTGMFPEGVDMAMDVDVTGLEQAPSVPDAYDSAYQIYYKGADATEQYVTGDRASFTSKVHVVPQADGTAIVELTAKPLGNAGKLADVKVDGQAVKYTDNKDGSRTYEVPVKDVKGTTDFTFGYTVSYGGSDHTMEHPFQLVLEGGTYAGYTATKAFLDEQIASATKKLAASKKDDAANDAYQKAIDAAQAVSDKQGATTTEYGKAVQDLDAASKTFNAAPDKPAAPTVEAGKVYTATGTFYDETGTTESSSMKGFFKPEIEVRKTADGTYEVDVKTIDAGVATAWKLSVSSGFDSTESDVVYSEAKGDSTVATYRLTGDDLGNIKLHVGYDGGGFKGDHNLILKVDAASVKEETVDKAALTDAIKAVPADKGSKTDEAFATLTAAKEAAQKVADQTDATTGDVAAAVAALTKAVTDFNASEDAKPESGLEAGKTYSVPVAFKKADDPTADSMSGGFFQDKATVVANEDGTYTVTLTTKLTAEQKGWMSDFKVGGKDAETTQVDDNNVSFTFTVDDVSQAIEASVKVAPMGSSPSLLVVLDASKAEEVKPAEVDKTSLNEAIASAQKLEQGNKTDAAWNALTDAIAEAQKVADDQAATQDDVNAAVDALNKAVETFKNSEDKPVTPATPDTSALQAAIKDAQAVEQGKKSDEAYATLQEAIKAAQKALDSATSQDEVDAAVSTLNAAVKAFNDSADVTPEPSYADTSKLEAAIKDAQAVTQGNKTDEAWAAFQAAIEAAQKVVDSKPTDQATVDAATDALATATKAFEDSADKPAETTVDKAKLSDAIDAAKKLTQGNKTDAAWNALQTAIKAAEAINADATADQATVDEAVKALNAAVTTFKASADKPTTPATTTTKPATTTTKPTASTASKSLPQTGDATGIAAAVAAAAAGIGAVGAGLAARLRGRRNRK